MSLFRRFPKPEPVKLRLFAPGEPGQHEQLTWLVLLIKELKAQVKHLTEQNEAIAFQVKGGEPITAAEQEVLDLRYQVQMLWHRNALLEKKMFRQRIRIKELQYALDNKAWDELAA